MCFIFLEIFAIEKRAVAYATFEDLIFDHLWPLKVSDATWFDKEQTSS